MKPAPLEYLAVSTTEEALAALADFDGSARLLAGRAELGAAPEHAAPAAGGGRRADPPAGRADQQGADGRLPRLRAGGIELCPRGARRSSGAPPRPRTRRRAAPQPLAARRAAVQERQRVARCVPGVQSVDVLAPDRYKVVATQKVGFISATFEMATEVESRVPLRSLGLASVGKSIKGAVGNVRSKDRVDFEPTPEGGTRVTLTSEVAVGGMLGALGHKDIAAKSREITEQFAQALQAGLRAAEAGR